MIVWFMKLFPFLGKYIGGWKGMAILAIAFLALSGTVYAQYQRIQHLNVKNEVLNQSVKDAIAERQRLKEEMEIVEQRLTSREEERKLLYAETNALKREINRLEEAVAREWLDTPIPESIRLLREDRLR